MKKNVELIKKVIELTYKTLEEQIEEKGSLSGNAYFDKTELAKLNSSKTNRIAIWNRIESEFEAEAFEIACSIENGFLYLDDNGTIHKATNQFRKAKGKIEHYVEKQNQWLVKKAPYFKNYPIQIQIPHHHLDNPNSPKSHKLKEGKPKLIKNLSTLMKTTLPEKEERSTFISAILENFYAVPSDPRTDRIHL